MLMARLLMVNYSQSVSTVLKIKNANSSVENVKYNTMLTARLKYNANGSINTMFFFTVYYNVHVLKFLRRNGALCLHAEANSFRLFKVPSSGL